MAEQPIKYSDLIAPDASIQDCIDLLQKLNKTYNDLYASVTKQAAGLQKSLQLVSGATEQGRKTTLAASKEADKLAKAQNALKNASSETAKQIEMLKIVTAEQTAINKANAKQAMASAGSHDDLSARLTKARLEWKKLSDEEKNNTKYGQDLQKEMTELRKRLNEMNKSVGDFTLQVGNYTIAGDSMKNVIMQGRQELIKMEQAGKRNSAEYQQLAQQLATFEDQMADTNAMLKRMASDTWGLDAALQALSVGTGGFAAVTGAMELFGAESDDVAEAQKTLQAAIAMVNGVTAIQNALQKQSALVTKLKAIQDKILGRQTKENTATTVANTAAIKAQGVATETTTKATKGLGKAMNALKSNPVILALGILVSLGVATVAIVKRVQGAQKRAYEEQLKQLEVLEAKQKEASVAKENDIEKTQQAIKLAQAEGKSQEEILKLREQELEQRTQMNTRNQTFYANEIDNLEKNQQKLAENHKLLAQADAKEIKLRDYKREEIEAENALLEKQIEIGKAQVDINNELIVSAAQLAEEKRQLAIDTAAAEEDSLRQLQDARNNLIKNQFKRERVMTEANYDRQIADLKIRLETERNLTEKQVQNINALIVELEKTKNIEIAKVNDAERQANIAAQRQTQDLLLSLYNDGLAKERAALDLNYQRETADLRNKLETDRDLTIQQRAELNTQLWLMQVQYWKQVGELADKARTDELNKELKAIELRNATRSSLNQQSDIEDTKRSIEIRRQLELESNKKLAEELRQDEKAINAKYDAEWLQTEDTLKREAAEQQLSIQQELAKSEIDLMQTSEKKKNVEKLKLEKQALEQRLKLNEEANIKMADAEVKTIENQIKKLDQDIKKEDAPKDLYDLLGLNVTDEQKSQLDESLAYAKQSVTDYFEYRKQLADQAVEASQREVDSARDALNAEREARAQGYANNVAMAEKELAAAKAQQRKALKQQQEAQKAQQKIQTIEQAVNMVTATAKIFGTMPIYLAIPAVALMWAAFAVSKVKANQLKSEQYGHGTVELLEGGSHQSGNDIDLGRKKDGTRRRAEGGEYFAVINKRSSRKYRKEIPQLINALNNDTFAEKYMHAYDATNAQIIPIFEGTAQLNSIAKDMREMNERGRQTVVYTADGWVEKRGNITRVVHK